MARTAPAALLAKLSQLAGDPLAQVRFAAELLATERRAQLLGPALAALEELPIPEARPALLRLYTHLDADGVHLDADSIMHVLAIPKASCRAGAYHMIPFQIADFGLQIAAYGVPVRSSSAAHATCSIPVGMKGEAR